MGFSAFGSPFGGGSGVSNILFAVVPLIVIAGFVFVFGFMIAQLVRGTRQWKRNNESPVLTVEAAVVAKRADTHYHRHHTGAEEMHHMSSSSTSYFATFEVESGDRLEFALAGSEYGLLVENDRGKLTFQGTRYLGFERGRN